MEAQALVLMQGAGQGKIRLAHIEDIKVTLPFFFLKFLILRFLLRV